MPRSGGTKGAYVGLDLLIDSLDSIVEGALDQVAKKAAAEAARHAKGRLASEIEIVAPGKGFRAIQPTKAAYYGKWMENGRAAFTVKGAQTKAAKVIMFEKNGVRHFVRAVGPEKAQPYMRFAQEYLASQGAADVQRILDARVSA